MPQAVQVATVATTPAADLSPIQVYLTADNDFLIPLVFPQFEIHVMDDYKDTWFGQKIKIEFPKAPFLGHAGVLLINGKTGVSKYYEYGRYKGPGPAGRVQKGNISDVKIVAGHITESSLKKTLRQISIAHGQSGNIKGVVLRGDVYANALAWLDAKFAENNDKARKAYDLGNHNCVTFAAELAESVGFSAPFRSRTVAPTLYMTQFQLSEIDLDYYFADDKLEIDE